MSKLILFIVFVSATGLMILAVELVRQVRRQRERLNKLLHKDLPASTSVATGDPISEFFFSTLPKLAGKIMPREQALQKHQQVVFIQAGIYRPDAITIFHAARLVCMVIPAVVFAIGGLAKFWDWQTTWMIVTVLFMMIGFNVPAVWLNRRKVKRQAVLRSTLPDAMDIIMICLEGGLTLAAALLRVAAELRTVHPDLAVEMMIVQRHIQLGKSAGEALRQFADRCDLEEVRSLSSAVLQSERFGASLVGSLRVQSDMLRLKRMSKAEEKAHRASVQVLFPTLLLIFPAVFIVLIGPAGLQIIEVFNKLQAQAVEAASAVDFPPLP